MDIYAVRSHWRPSSDAIPEQGLPENICIKFKSGSIRSSRIIQRNWKCSPGYAACSNYVAGLFFSTYEGAKRVLSASLPVPAPIVHSAASSVAELASCLVLAPAEVIKQNAQMIQHTKSHNNQRLFTGYTALIARNLPLTALQFPAFEQIRTWLWQRRRQQNRQDNSLTETGLIAGISAASAGSLAAFVTTPSDVIKTRMMLSVGSNTLDSSKQTFWTVGRDVVREKGMVGLFRGGLFRSAWTAIGSGLYLGTYDTAKLWLRRRKLDRKGGTLC
ncbi:hypothetical protein Golomagni_06787 [Golovinomyces magnicellulatus]|nr:hypothetical protein Golomagni_06787 [Golovinomyces magnicellulatus]